MIEQEIYTITVEHYMQDEKGERHRLEEPIKINSIYDRSYGYNTAILLNEMFDKLKHYALLKAGAGNENN